ncbi:flavin monoamine oxidase family protein [Microbulbifer taiwanensis]|uniref:Flavin monoamine oxidase family protein n=1 Tax=Microbulbifer taiwanensis TaxID=986746 RepID=A0ABW1YSH0_9GAMM|nr:FAD-dependent oxidoreductase [Microbulbifer taiwanensis]
MAQRLDSRSPLKGNHHCDVAIVGAGLAGLCAARDLDTAGLQVLVLEAQERVGGRTLTEHIDSSTFIDHGGQWVSPGQERIVALAEELGVALFPNWDAGLTVDWSGGVRSTYQGMFPPGSGHAEAQVRDGARKLTQLAAELPLGRPWEAPSATEWDSRTYHHWLAENIPSPLAQQGLARALEGVFGGGPGELSLLAALAIIRSGAHEISRLVSAENPGPEHRFIGGAQQLCERMAQSLDERIITGAYVAEIEHGNNSVQLYSGDLTVSARRAIVTLPPVLAGRIRYSPALPAARDHLTQRVPMGWVIKVHCVYPERFWVAEQLSGKVTSDGGPVRVVADNSPPNGSPGILVGFIEGAEARRLAAAGREQRCAETVAQLRHYFGTLAGRPDAYFEHAWGDDEFARGAYGGYWTPGVWTSYGHTLAAPIGTLHWAGTETSEAWNGKLEGAVHSGRRAAAEVLAAFR